VGGEAIAVGFHPQVPADLSRAGQLFGRGAREIHGLGAGLVELSGPCAERVHVK
jgi:hypothetical protein